MIKLETNPSDGQLRQFGWIALFGFPLVGMAIGKLFLGIAPFWDYWSTSFFLWFLGAGVLTLVLSKLHARLVLPIFVTLMVIAVPIGLVISWTLIGVIYYLMFTPVSLFFRLIGRDSMNRKLDPDAKSYWHVRTEQPSPASYLKQY